MEDCYSTHTHAHTQFNNHSNKSTKSLTKLRFIRARSVRCSTATTTASAAATTATTTASCAPLISCSTPRSIRKFLFGDSISLSVFSGITSTIISRQYVIITVVLTTMSSETASIWSEKYMMINELPTRDYTNNGVYLIYLQKYVQKLLHLFH